ncbi:ATP-binding cassette domain-containing protein [Xanthobacter sp. V4C-4]
MNITCRSDHPVPLDVAFEVRGLTVLLGRSGEGKTTLLKALAGLLPASGQPFDGLPPQARPIGYVPQGLCLFPHLSTWQNVAFSLDGPARQAKALALLERSDSPDLPSGGRGKCPAASSSGLRWPGRWRANPTCCCSTSPPRRSIRSPATR